LWDLIFRASCWGPLFKAEMLIYQNWSILAMKSWNHVHQIMKALFLVGNKPKHKAQWYWGSPQHKHILSICWAQTFVLMFLLMLISSVNALVYITSKHNYSESLPSCIPISRRFGTENKAIFHSTHAHTSLCMCCSYPHYHYAHICGCVYVLVKLNINKSTSI